MLWFKRRLHRVIAKQIDGPRRDHGRREPPGPRGARLGRTCPASAAAPAAPTARRRRGRPDGHRRPLTGPGPAPAPGPALTRPRRRGGGRRAAWRRGWGERSEGLWGAAIKAPNGGAAVGGSRPSAAPPPPALGGEGPGQNWGTGNRPRCPQALLLRAGRRAPSTALPAFPCSCFCGCPLMARRRDSKLLSHPKPGPVLVSVANYTHF